MQLPGRLLLALSPWLFAACSTSSSDVAPIEGWALVYSEDFDSAESLAGFEFSDPKAWTWNEEGGTPSLELLGKSQYTPSQRSPHSIALVPNLLVADFDLEVDLLQTGRNYGHRDMCLFFGFQSPANFYYVHMATSPDENAHNVFLVDDAPRTNLADVTPEGIDWGDNEWQRVRLERRTGPGSIRVFWNDSPEPILEASDTNFDWGRLGFGSFDDSGRVAAIRVWAPEARSAEGEDAPFE